jgi:hypothetical protein
MAASGLRARKSPDAGKPGQTKIGSALREIDAA